MTQETLVKFGKSFQTKTIASLLSDKLFLDQIIDVLRPEFFDTETDRMIVKYIESYYHSYRVYPTVDAMKVYVSKIDADVVQVAIEARLKQIFREIDNPSTDLDFIKEQFLEFCKNQKLKSAILSSVDLLERSEYEKIKNIVVDAVNSGTDRNIGHQFIEDLESRLQEVNRDCTKTGWDTINELMDGGLGPGELGVVVAPAGIGKSWCLIHLGGSAVRAGLNVVHFTLELNERYVGARYDSFFTGMPSRQIKSNDVNKELLRSTIKNLKGHLVIKEYPTKTATVGTFSAMLERISLMKGKPDLVIVDYADIVAATRGNDARHLELGSIYEELRGLAGSYQVPIWTASQANRSSLEDDVIQADKIAESYNKVMISDFIVSVSRKITDKVTNTARFHVIKNRFGPDGLTFPASMDTSIGKIDIFEPNSTGGQLIETTIKNAPDLERELMRKKYNELNLG